MKKKFFFNQFIVAPIGKFIYDNKLETIRMNKVSYYLKDKVQLLRRLENKKLRNIIEDMRERKQNKNLKIVNKILTHDFKCICCMERPKNMIIKPYMHMCICS